MRKSSLICEKACVSSYDNIEDNFDLIRNKFVNVIIIMKMEKEQLLRIKYVTSTIGVVLMTVQLKMTIVVILTLLFTLGLNLGLFNLTMAVVATHFGSISVFSDVFTGKGNSSNPINEFDPINKEIYVTETIKWSNPTAAQPYPHTVTFIDNESSPILMSKISNIIKTFQSNNLQSLISNLIKLNNSTRI